MRIALVTQRFYPLVGGAESVLRALAGQWVRRGCHVHVLAARYQRAWPVTDAVDGIPITRLPLPSVRFLGTARYVLALRRQLLKTAHQFDVVYVSMLKHQAWAALSVRHRLGRPVVLRAEGAGATGDVAWQETALLGTYIRRRCKTADAIVAPSSLVRQELIKAGYPAEKIHLIRNAVCCQTYQPPPPHQRQRLRRRFGLRGPAVGYLGRLSPEKGLDDLIAAWPSVKQAVPDATLVVAGGPSESEWARRLRELPGVEYVGELLSPAQLLQALDLFVLPSRYEGISIALLEAMACGVIPVVSAIAGNLEVVGHRTPVGWTFPPEDPVRLAAALVGALRAADRWPELRRSARQRVEREFSLEQNAQQHLELFQAVLAMSGPECSQISSRRSD